MSEPESPAEYIPLSDAEYAPYVKLVALGASDPIDAIRAAIFEGQITDDEIKAAFEVSQPTLERYIAAGLPHYRVGNQRRFDVSDVREWVLSHKAKNAAARGRGRPRK